MHALGAIDTYCSGAPLGSSGSIALKSGLCLQLVGCFYSKQNSVRQRTIISRSTDHGSVMKSLHYAGLLDQAVRCFSRFALVVRYSHRPLVFLPL